MELLVVLTIMGILSVLAVSSVSSLRSTALSATGNQMVDVFAYARQHAISNNDYTAVVILTSGSSACSAYSLLELPPSSTDGSRGTAWTQLTAWKYLPKGVVFENISANASTSDTFIASSLNPSAVTPPAGVLPVALPTSYPFQGSQLNLTTTGTAIVQCFQPDGTLIGGQPLTLRLIEGTAITTTTPATTSPTGGTDYYDLYFVANTGTTKIGRP